MQAVVMSPMIFLKRKLYSVFKKVLNLIFKMDPFFFKVSNKLTINFIERINLVYTAKTKFGNLLFSTPNELTYWRAQTLLTKEPDTIDWISTFQENEIMFDIGANVGLYSLCAAKKKVKVFAFEPESQNYAILNKNIFLNGLDEHVKAFNIAMSNSTLIDSLYVKGMTIGGALNNFGDNLDLNRKKFNQSFKQGMLSTSIDDLIDKFMFPMPDHIKIDVDGLEPEIIEGAKKVLSNKHLKSVLVELNVSLKRDLDVITYLETLDFKCVSKMQPPFCPGSAFENIFNFIFVRK